MRTTGSGSYVSTTTRSTAGPSSTAMADPKPVASATVPPSSCTGDHTPPVDRKMRTVPGVGADRSTADTTARSPSTTTSRPNPSRRPTGHDGSGDNVAARVAVTVGPDAIA